MTASSSTRRIDGRAIAGLVAVLVVAVDQLTKWWALETLPGRPIEVIWTLQLRLTFNTSTAFNLPERLGIDGDLSGVLAALILLAVAAGVYLVARGRFVDTSLGAVAAGLLLGGATGNLIDRALRTDGGGLMSGGVVDFVDLGWWPAFNVADAAIVVGALLVVWMLVGRGARSDGATS